MISRRHVVRGFSLVEVVLAIGIFAFVVVAVMGLFGSALGGVRDVVDRDGMVAVADSAAERVSGLSRAEIAAIPAGTNLLASGRPLLYGYLGTTPGQTNSLTWTNISPPVASVQSGRVYRVALYRANLDASTEAVFATTNASYPVRMEISVLAAGQSSTRPAMSWSFHRNLQPRQ